MCRGRNTMAATAEGDAEAGRFSLHVPVCGEPDAEDVEEGAELEGVEVELEELEPEPELDPDPDPPALTNAAILGPGKV